jgi:hypothetical protein
LKLLSEIFYNFAIGFGAIIAGIVGVKIIDENISNKRVSNCIEDFRRQFHREKLNIDYILTNKPGVEGVLYLLNERKKSRHWIRLWQIFTDLNFND